VVEEQEIQALALTVCTTLMDKATLHFDLTNYACVSHGSLNIKR